MVPTEARSAHCNDCTVWHVCVPQARLTSTTRAVRRSNGADGRASARAGLPRGSRGRAPKPRPERETTLSPQQQLAAQSEGRWHPTPDARLVPPRATPGGRATLRLETAAQRGMPRYRLSWGRGGRQWPRGRGRN